MIDTYQCEWATVVRDPEKRKLFKQFVNSDDSESCIEIVSERGQPRPEFWVNDTVSLEQFREASAAVLGDDSSESSSDSTSDSSEFSPLEWVYAGKVSDFPKNGGATIKHGQSQIAVYNFSSRGEWYASQNMCPHKKAFVLSQIGRAHV